MLRAYKTRKTKSVCAHLKVILVEKKELCAKQAHTHTRGHCIRSPALAAMTQTVLIQVMKLMAIISVVFADFFMSINSGNGVFCTGNVK